MKIAVLLLLVCVFTCRAANEDLRTKQTECRANEVYDVGYNLDCDCYLKGGRCRISDNWCQKRCICRPGLCVDKDGKCITIDEARQKHRKHCPCEDKTA